MRFGSIEYLFCLSIVAILVSRMLPKWRIPILLLASIAFYMLWDAEHIIALFIGIFVTYICAFQIGRARSPERKKRWLGVGVFATIALYLFYFYGPNSFKIINTIPGVELRALAQLGVPLGLSYISFKQISYLIDVYDGILNAERSIAKYSLYISFFPSITMGPIDRASSFLKQTSNNNRISYTEIRYAFHLILWGLFKKIVIADRLAIITSSVYTSPQGFDGFITLATSYLSFIQLYCDFSGYTDIALGSAKLLGFDLSVNFRNPLSAKNISDFWKRWHITLSSWLTDYIYSPIASRLAIRKSNHGAGILGNTGLSDYILAITATWLVSGIWHGVGSKYIVWGLMHALYFTLYQATAGSRKKVKRFIKSRPKHGIVYDLICTIGTFNMVCLANIVFMSVNLSSALVFLRSLSSGYAQQISSADQFKTTLRGLGYSGPDLKLTLVYVAVFLLIEWNTDSYGLPKLLNKAWAIRWPVYYAILASVIFFGGGSANNFIYQQF